MSLGPHLSREVSILLVSEIISAIGKQRHCLDRECEDIVVPLFVEPVHEMFLNPGKGLPLRCGSVRESEIAEHATEIRLVEIADVPEHCLVSPVAGRHIHGMYDLLEIIVDDLDESTFLEIVLHHLVETAQIVVTVILPHEVVEIHQELRCSHCTHELG